MAFLSGTLEKFLQSLVLINGDLGVEGDLPDDASLPDEIVEMLLDDPTIQEATAQLTKKSRGRSETDLQNETDPPSENSHPLL